MKRAISEKRHSSVFIVMLSVMLILQGAWSTFAYTSEDFTIDIPDDWVEMAENAWTDGAGNSLNIQINYAGSSLSADEYYSEQTLDELEKNGLLECNEEAIRLTKKGLDVGNVVFAEFVDA